MQTPGARKCGGWTWDYFASGAAWAGCGDWFAWSATARSAASGPVTHSRAIFPSAFRVATTKLLWLLSRRIPTAPPGPWITTGVVLGRAALAAWDCDAWAPISEGPGLRIFRVVGSTKPRLPPAFTGAGALAGAAGPLVSCGFASSCANAPQAAQTPNPVMITTVFIWIFLL